ncbi:MAG TPA: hypothetical protein VH760_05960 [Gaiellaceae bacterium]
MRSLLPGSHRARRRLLWAAAVLVAAAVAALVITLLPEHHGGIASPVGSGPVQTVAQPRQVRVTPRARRQIDRLLDRFVPAAVARRDPVEARAYVTPSLRAQASPAEWRTGTIPVPPYDPAGSTFHGWTTITSYPRDLSVRLTLEPKRAGEPVGSFVVNLKRIGSRWLVDGIYTEGLHGGTPAQAAGTQAATTTERVIGGSHGRLGVIWILVPVGLLSLIVIVPAFVFTRDWVADRRVSRRYRRDPKELPPLPRSRERP